MPLYLGRFSYTTDAVKALLDQPQDRSAAAREVADAVEIGRDADAAAGAEEAALLPDGADREVAG